MNKNQNESVQQAADRPKTLRIVLSIVIAFFVWMAAMLAAPEITKAIRDVPITVDIPTSAMLEVVDGADTKVSLVLDGKQFDLDELLARIERNLLRSQKDTPNLCLTFGELSINTSSKIVTVADEIIVLTAKEYQLVELLAKYPDKVFSKQNLYESIWQEPFARDNDVINTHISNLRKKLKGEGCRIKTIWGLGYRFAK